MTPLDKPHTTFYWSAL